VLWAGKWILENAEELIMAQSKIQTYDQYIELQNAVDEAKERLDGAGASGAHYLLNNILRRYGVFGMSREETIKLGQNLCNEFLKNRPD
jgi:hypothetical protein